MGHPAYNEVDHITINRLLCLLLLHDASVNVLIVSCRKGWGGGKGGLLGDGHGHPTTMYIGEGEDLSPDQSMCERLQSVKYNNGGI